jgi:hypothetical protein
MKDIVVLESDIIDAPSVPSSPIEEVDPAPAPIPTFDLVRASRAPFLIASDWTQSEDSPLSAEKKAEWATYRQALRDLTNGDKIILPGMDGWPTPPSA